MLVLTRKQQEKIRIGDDIVITVLRTKGKAVRLGIEAPAEVPVIRGELALRERSTAECRQSVGGVDERSSPRSVEIGTSDSPASRAEAAWPSTCGPSRQSATLPGSPAVQVSFARVPREKLGRGLPAAVPATGPLRAMLDRRSLTT